MVRLFKDQAIQENMTNIFVKLPKAVVPKKKIIKKGGGQLKFINAKIQRNMTHKYHNINDPASFLHLQPMDNKNSICVLPCFQHPCHFQAATTIYKQITNYVEYR